MNETLNSCSKQQNVNFVEILLRNLLRELEQNSALINADTNLQILKDKINLLINQWNNALSATIFLKKNQEEGVRDFVHQDVAQKTGEKIILSESQEILWCDIIGYEDTHAISSTGLVYSKKRKLILSPNLLKGYKAVVLLSNKKLTTTSIHRLVAIHFIPNPNNYPDVDHIDRDKLNNSISNLRWVSESLNALNSKLRKNNKANCNGVSFVTKTGKWKSDITINGNRKHLGFFNSIHAAVRARKNAEIKYLRSNV